jgi:threonine/homoserine/homoserine lactone efflux protein
VLDEAIGGVLPAAIAVAISPIPIVAVIAVLTGARSRTAGPAFAVGWVVGLAVVTTVLVLVLGGADDPGSATATGVQWGRAVLGLVLLVLAARTWRGRPRDGETEPPPKWMSSMDTLTVARGLEFGALLSSVNPKNLALTAAAASSIAGADLDGPDTAIAVVVFVLVGSVTVAGSVLAHVLAPTRTAAPLASIRTFMAANNAVIMMVILVIFGVKLIGDAIAGA